MTTSERLPHDIVVLTAAGRAYLHKETCGVVRVSSGGDECAPDLKVPIIRPEPDEGPCPRPHSSVLLAFLAASDAFATRLQRKILTTSQHLRTYFRLDYNFNPT